MSDIRFSQTERDRQTQDSLEAVHSTLGHVVDRLAMIEGDLRDARAAPAAAPQPAPAPRPAPTAAATIPPQVKPELPNPAAAEPHFAAAPRDFHAAAPAIAAITPRAISEILEPHAAPPRAAIEPALPPDHPLEPGTRPAGRAGSTSERIAASENAISEIAASTREQASATNFIAAARRAAQAAAASPPADKASRSPLKSTGIGPARPSSTITSKIRSLLVGASVVVIVLGSFKMAMTMLDGGGARQLPAVENSSVPPVPVPAPAEDSATPATPAPAMTSPTPIGRQSFNDAAPADGSASVAIPQAATAAPAAGSDVTGAIPVMPTPTAGKLPLVQIPPTEKLPDAIGGPVLRSAALKGDPAAAYEIGVRYAEGKGVATNLDEAAKWYGRAAAGRRRAGDLPARDPV